MTRTFISVASAALVLGARHWRAPLARATGARNAQHEPRTDSMTTRETIEGYFGALKKKGRWQDALATDMVFTSYASPVKQVAGRDAYLEATKRFHSSISDFEVRQLLVDGDRAVALTHYTVQPPNGAPPFASDVAESFWVRGGKIASFDIYFDSAPFPK